MSHTFKTTVEGKEVDVALPEGYATPEDMKALQNNLHASQRKLATIEKNQLTPEKAVDDPAFVKSVFEAKGIPFDEDTLEYTVPENYKDEHAVEAAIKERLTKKEDAWVKSRLNPIVSENEALTSSLSATRDALKRLMIEQSARNSGVSTKKFQANPFNGRASVHEAASLFNHFDPDIGTDGNFVMKQNDQVVTDKTGNPVTPLTYWEFFKQQNHDKVELMKEWFPDNRQDGSDFNHTSGGGGKMTISLADAENTQKYKAALKRAQEAGVELDIV